VRIPALVIMVLFFTIGVISTPECLAAIYKYVDKDGMIYFVSDLQSVPEQYRASAKIVSEEFKDQVKTQANPHEQLGQTTIKDNEATHGSIQNKPVTENANRKSFGRRALISAVIIISALFIFVILKIVDDNHKKSVAIVRVIIIWGVSVYLLYAHVSDVITVFQSASSAIEHAQKESEEKGKNAANLVKALDALAQKAGEAASTNPAQGEEKKE
jgi:hypothetical protein